MNIASLNKILRQNAYIIKKIDSALSNKKKDQVQLDQAFIEVMLYYVCYLIVITGVYSGEQNFLENFHVTLFNDLQSYRKTV